MSEDTNTVIQISFILLVILSSVNLILSIIQLINKEGYGYNGILSMIEDNPLLLEINQAECDSYISEINFKKYFTKIKAILVVVFNFFIIFRAIFRMKNLNVGCKIGILFMVIFIIGFVCELVFVSMSLDFYNKTKYNSKKFEKCNNINDIFVISKDIFEEAKEASKWIIKVEKAILSFTCFTFLPLIFNSCFILLTIDSEAEECVNKELCWICSCLYDSSCKCSSNFCDSISNCFSSCCDSCANCCSRCCGNDYDSLKRENNDLKRNIRDLQKENANLKRLNSNLESMTERMRKENENASMRIIKYQNSEEEVLLKKEMNELRNKNINNQNEISNLRKENNNLNQTIIKLKSEISIQNNNNNIRNNELQKEINSLKNKNNNIENEKTYFKNEYIKAKKEIQKLENKLLFKNIEEKQMKVIEFYLKKEITKEFNITKSSIIGKFLEEINNNFGLYIDSNKFTKIALYYIKSKLTEHLTDPNNSEIFSDPMISIDGITFDNNIIIPGINYVENKLVSELCRIIKNNKGDLEMEDFIKIKQLLKNKQNDEYFKNPIVISEGINLGETLEGNDFNNQKYKNIVILQIINDIRELLEDEFFNFEGIKTPKSKEEDNKKKLVDYNNIIVINFLSGDGLVSQGIKCLKNETFAEVEEKLYKIYDEYRETNNIFLHGGRIILRFKTIEANQIKDGDKIQLQLPDD